MSNFAQGSYNSPAYIHPWVGPSGPAFGMSRPYGKGGAPAPGQPGPQVPGPGEPSGTPIDPTAPNIPGVTPLPSPGGPGPAAPQQTPVMSQQQVNDHYSGAGDGSAYYSNATDALGNMAFGPLGALGRVAMGVYGGQPTSYGQNFATVPAGWMYNHDNPSAGVIGPSGAGQHDVGAAPGTTGGYFDDTSDGSDFDGDTGFDPDEGVGDGSW